MCVSTVYSVLSPSPAKKYHRHVTRVGFEPTTLAILEQCLQLDYRGCPAARGSSKPMFWQRVPQRI